MSNILKACRDIGWMRPAAIALSMSFMSMTAADQLRAETLEQALARAYSTNPVLLAARAKLRAEDENVAQAISGWRPTVELSSDNATSHVNTSGVTSPVSQNRSPRTHTLTLTQSLYAGGGTVSETRRAKAEVQAERARTTGTEQDVLLSAATAYMDVVRDQAVLELNTSNERVLRSQLAAARDRFQVGEVTRTDVAQAESRLSRAISDRVQSEGNLAASRAAYLRQIGENPANVSKASPLGGLPANEAETIAKARAGSTDVVAANYDEKAARAYISVVRADMLPTLDLEGELKRRDQSSTKTNRSDSATITAQLTIPLYQGGGPASRLREAKQVASERRRTLDAATREAIEAATRAWEALQTARAQIQAFTAQVRASSIALEGVQQEASVGSRTVLDVLDAEQELLDAKVNLVRAERDEVVASFRVRAAVGELTAKSMALPVEIYNFDVHYNDVRGKWFGTGIKGE